MSAVVTTTRQLKFKDVSSFELIQKVATSCIATIFKLTPSERGILLSLCAHYNSMRGDSFPSQELLSRECNISTRQVTRCVKKLIELDLLVKYRKKRNNMYKFSKKFFSVINVTYIGDNMSLVNNNHRNDNNIIMDNNKKTPSKNDDVDILNSPKKRENKIKNNVETSLPCVEAKLKLLGFSDYRKVVSENSKERIEKLLAYIDQKKPANAGAYLRALLRNPDALLSKIDGIESQQTKPTLIESMSKAKYWLHVPSGKRCQALPDIGTHFLFKYYREEKMVEFFDLGLCDKLENFTVVEDKG